ncbi:LysR family transcriptional regulator [uncultured Shimia sp.]|uniref:LysR family transcriptional regulator n=1 Tax=uncultured Shimia sp. TaxID=573152 RepID=UPI0026353B59|nr:LysR family transcriptional regulator [uncultured Shimia sp.]
MNNDNWDDIRFVLAVAQEGSLNAAAKKLGVTHATVMRRVAAFEARHNRPIFRKLGSGYQVLPEAETILKAAQNVEDAMYSIDRAVLGTDQTLFGTVKIASTDSICQLVLPKILGKISGLYPDLEFTVLSANSYHDLSRLSADIAIRPTKKLEDDLDGEIVGELGFAVYGPTHPVSQWIGLKGPLGRSVAADWMENNLDPAEIAHTGDSFLVIQEMIAEGLGKAFLPRFVGDSDNRLKRLDNAAPIPVVPLWMAAQKEVVGNVRLQAVWTKIAAMMRAEFSAA